jgi:CelD/BcsL family acetyltransferase involved in cellulose biosynthesis
MEQFRPAWDQLYTPGRHSVFQSFAWNHLAAQQFLNDAPYVVLAESDSSMAIVPAAVTGGEQITMLGDMLFDYRACLCAGAPEAHQAALGKLAELGLPMEITAVREADLEPFGNLEPSVFCNAPSVQRQSVTADQFTGEHSRLGRFFRRLAKQRVELQQHFGDNEKLVRWIYEKKGEQFSGSAVDIFNDPRRVDFMARAAALDPGACEIFTFSTPQQIVAALVTFRDAHVRRFYTIWFDQEWAQYSPGVVLVFAITQRSLAEGLDCDYMTGEQPHKVRLATGMMRLFRVNATPAMLAQAAREPAALQTMPTLLTADPLPEVA